MVTTKSKMDQDLLSGVLSNTPALVIGILKAGAKVLARDSHGWTYLHFAADRYSVDAARILIDHGAEVNAQDAHGNTPLARAVYRSKRGTELELIKLLMVRGADPSIKNKAGESALDLAKGNRVLEELLKG